MQQEITSFQQEYLAELEIAETQLLALAGAVPEESYGWSPVLGARGNFFGKPEAVRRLYLRMLAHSHEHMGQAIAYVRSMGYKVPWPDPLRDLDRVAVSEAAHQLTA